MSGHFHRLLTEIVTLLEEAIIFILIGHTDAFTPVQHLTRMCLSRSWMHFHQHEVALCKVSVYLLLLNLFPKKTVKRCLICFSYITADYICLSFGLLVWQNKTLEDVTMGSEKL